MEIEKKLFLTKQYRNFPIYIYTHEFLINMTGIFRYFFYMLLFINILYQFIFGFAIFFFLFKKITEKKKLIIHI